MKNNQALAYFLLRITMGVNMLIHGWVKLGNNYQPFIAKTSSTFSITPLPGALVRISAYVIPWAELVIGITLIVGICSRLSVVAAQMLMILLIAGQCFLMQWNTVGVQLIYSVIFTWLLYKGKHNQIALDHFLKHC